MNAPSPAARISPMETPSLLPLSLAQQDFLFPRGNMNASLRLRGELSEAALRRALAFVIRRHEGLRMRIVRHAGRPMQRIVDATDSHELPVVRVENLAAAEDYLASQLRRPADLENEGPLRAELLRIDVDDHVLLLAIHTAAIDAHALALLLRELLIAYDCLIQGREPSLPPAMRYTDYVLGDGRCGEHLTDAQKSYWRQVLSDCRHPVPGRVDPSKHCIGTSKAAASSLSVAEARRVQAFASAANVSLAASLYAVIYLAVSSLYSVSDVIATVTYSGRDTRDVQTLCAKTSRLFPMRVAVKGDVELSRFARQVQSAFICGTMGSRAPFTAARAAAQVGAGHPPIASTAAPEATGRDDIQLVIADNRMPKREIDVPLSSLSAERLLMGPRPYEGMDGDETAPFRNALVLSLIRDPDLAARRPVIFSGAFHTHVIEEREVRRLLQRMWAIARLLEPQHLHLTVGGLFSRLPGSST